MASSSYPPRAQSYAPTPYSYTPQSTLNTSISMDQEVTLPTNPAERDVLDSLAELYSIITTLEGLEKAFNRDSVMDREYTDICWRLMRQYKSSLNEERVAREFGDLDSFMREWDMECPRAAERLRIGVPATVEHAGGPSSSNQPQSHIGGAAYGFQAGGTPSSSTPLPSAAGTGAGSSVQQTIAATENFITFFDALKLGIGSKDQLHPLLTDVITSVTKVAGEDFEGRGNIVKWLIKLNQMRATDELGPDERREIEFEMDDAYRGFKKAVGG